jgi:hypothetical protein
VSALGRAQCAEVSEGVSPGDLAEIADLGFDGLGNAAVVDRLFASPGVADLFAEAPAGLFGAAAGDAAALSLGRRDGDDIVFDNDGDAADYCSTLDADGPGITGCILGMIAHTTWETRGYAPCAPGDPIWLDRTIGTICGDIEGGGTPAAPSLRPDGASLLGPRLAHDAELKPDRIQDTAVPQLAAREASFASAGVQVQHDHGPWSEGLFGPLAAAFGMTLEVFPGAAPGVVAYRWRRKAPETETERVPIVVPTPREVYDGARSKVDAVRDWLLDTVDEHPWVGVALVVALIAAGITLAVLLATRVLPVLLPLLPFVL